MKSLASFNLDPGRRIDIRDTGGTIDTNGFDTTITQGISGTGPLTKASPGTLTLDGASTLTGQVIVAGGRLVLNGSLAGDVLVNAAGTLAGSGAVGGNLTVNGTVAPGNSIGTLTVNGIYAQAALSPYIAEVNGTSQGDRIAFGGNIALSGGSVAVRPEAGAYRRTTTTPSSAPRTAP